MTHLITIKAGKALQALAVLDLVWQLQVHRAQFETLAAVENLPGVGAEPDDPTFNPFQH